MTTYYKATRPDCTDFRTGTILYETGKCARPAPHDGSRQICGPGLLHAATVPTETLVGGSWPCRLFEVAGKPVAGLDSVHPHKAGFRQLAVGTELPAHQVFGPQGESVAALIERTKLLTHAEATALAAARYAAGYAAGYAAWSAARYAARDAARDAAGDAAWSAARYAARDAAWSAARSAAWSAARDAARSAAWSAARYAARDAAWSAARDAARDAAWSAARSAARYAAGDAAMALVAKDLITEEQFNLLYGPWASVVDA